MPIPRRMALVMAATGFSVSPAMALTDVFAAPKSTTSVAAFPDVPAAEPRGTPRGAGRDATDDLLRGSPYEPELAKGSDDATSPYAGAADVPVANPYVDELRRVGTEATDPENPYSRRTSTPSTGERALKDPYAREADAHPASAPGTSGTELKDPYGGARPEREVAPPEQGVTGPGESFDGVVLIDGIAARKGLPFPLQAGPHTASVFPRDGRPYQVPIFVRPGRWDPLPIR